MNSFNFIKFEHISGSLEEQEYFSEVLLGIKHVIQGHLHDVQGKFQERYIIITKVELKLYCENFTNIQPFTDLIVWKMKLGNEMK